MLISEKQILQSLRLLEDYHVMLVNHGHTKASDVKAFIDSFYAQQSERLVDANDSWRLTEEEINCAEVYEL